MTSPSTIVVTVLSGCEENEKPDRPMSTEGEMFMGDIHYRKRDVKIIDLQNRQSPIMSSDLVLYRGKKLISVFLIGQCWPMNSNHNTNLDIKVLL